MPVDEPIDQPGFFWLPENDAERLPGTLTVDTSGRITLRLFAETGVTLPDRTQASLHPFVSSVQGNPVHDRVHGLIRGQRITLDRCTLAPMHWSMTMIPWLTGGITEGSYMVKRAYVGAWYGVGATPTFSRIGFRINGLQEWLMISGLRHTPDIGTLPHEGVTVSFDPPAPITVQLSSGITLSFKFSYSLPSVSIAPAEATITQSPYLSLQAHSAASFDELASTATTFKRFLSFAADQACDVTSIVGVSSELAGDGREMLVKIYTGQSDFPQPTQDPSWARMLFTFRDVESRFPDALDGWLHTVSELEPAINLYDALMVNAYRHPDGRFLATAQAIEALHRRLFPTRTHMSDQKFRSLVAALTDAASSDQREWVQTRLKYANEPTFSQRVGELLKQFATHFGTVKERRRFRRDVVNIRNRLTHLPANSDLRPVDTKLLITTQIKLEVLFQLHMLRQLGFDDDSIDKIAQERLLPKTKIEFF